MNDEKISFVASGIIQGLQEAIQSEKNNNVEGVRRRIVYRAKPQLVSKKFDVAQRENQSDRKILFGGNYFEQGQKNY